MKLEKEPIEEGALVQGDGGVIWERGPEGWYGEDNKYGPAFSWSQVQATSTTLVQVWDTEDLPSLFLQEQWGLLLENSTAPAFLGGSREKAIETQADLLTDWRMPSQLCRRLVSSWEIQPTEE